jgi:hypothetical protein
VASAPIAPEISELPGIQTGGPTATGRVKPPPAKFIQRTNFITLLFYCCPTHVISILIDYGNFKPEIVEQKATRAC